MSLTPARLSIVTLGVRDLASSTAFYARVFGGPPGFQSEAITFFKLRGTWLALYPIAKLAEDIGVTVTPPPPGQFSGVTFAHNARSKEHVRAILDHVRAAGAKIVKEPQDVFWGGYSGYFADPDGHYWEVASAPGFSFAADGALQAEP